MCEVRRNECPCGHAPTSYLGLREKQPTKTILRENGVESSRAVNTPSMFGLPHLLGSNRTRPSELSTLFPSSMSHLPVSSEMLHSLARVRRGDSDDRRAERLTTGAPSDQMLAGGLEKVLERRRDTAGYLYIHEKMADAGENSFFIPKFRFPVQKGNLSTMKDAYMTYLAETEAASRELA
ncbi:hypothetical protein FALBO_13227 [Fusarium albosuccineum]|uniref:Uncharacterized protein n=1 Tax=Fusarium albosuccineum TaxID=1237068 RepID=A0A8H4L2G6_9HYPO|nr:hypothetical protein FALBO_13227 [Fusarium albosuccineum]